MNPLNHNHKKFVDDYDKLGRVTSALQEIGKKIVVTIGSWDVLHIGHARYLEKAKTYGDILVVGVDSDESIKRYKGPLRPLVPQDERLEMLEYLGFVDFITLVDDVDNSGSWQYGLIQVVKPDVYIAVEDSYSPEQIEELKSYCGDVFVLPRQAENTSTSNFIQKTIKGHLEMFLVELEGKRR